MRKLSDAPFENTIAGRQAVAEFRDDHLAELPAGPRAALKEAMLDPVPPTQFAAITEALYAAIKTEGVEAMTGPARTATAFLAGQCAGHVNTWWSTLSDGARGAGIYKAMRRELGETTTPDASADPAVAAKFAPPEPAPAVEPIPAPEPAQ